MTMKQVSKLGLSYSAEELQEIDGRLAVVDVDSRGNRFVRFWVDSLLDVPMEERTNTLAAEEHVEARDTRHVQAMVPPFPLLPTGQGKEHRKHQTGGRGLTPRYVNGIAGATHPWKSRFWCKVPPLPSTTQWTRLDIPQE